LTVSSVADFTAHAERYSVKNATPHPHVASERYVSALHQRSVTEKTHQAKKNSTRQAIEIAGSHA
jgi:hypothetical protein